MNNIDYKKISKEEMYEYIEKAKRGCEESKKIIYLSHVKIIYNRIEKKARNYKDKDDLFQYLSETLMKCIYTFDTSKNYRFSTYLYSILDKKIIQFCYENREVMINYRALVESNNFKISKEKLEEKYERKLSDNEICEKLNIKEGKIKQYNTIANLVSIKSLSKLSENFKCEPVKDNLALKQFYDCENKILIEYLFKKIIKQERNVIMKRYFEDKTQIQTSKELKMSQPHIARIEKLALRKMRSILISEGFKN